MLELLQRDAGGALVIIVANVAGDELNAITRMGRRYGSLTVVHITGIPHRGDPRSANGYGPGGRQSNGGRPQQQLAVDTPVVAVNETAPFDVSWNQFMRSRQKRRAARSGG